MLLIDRTLLRLAKGLWGWILAIALVRFVALVCMTRFAGVIGGSLGEMLSGSAGLDLASSVWAAVLLTAGLLAARILQGELEYRCSSKARMDLRDTIRKEYAGHTVILISHRMSTLSDCERIYAVRDEKMVPLFTGQ